ncbi:MAG: hypothetical protein ACI9KE_003440, partial [Polyangiales bacterium]
MTVIGSIFLGGAVLIPTYVWLLTEEPAAPFIGLPYLAIAALRFGNSANARTARHACS